MTKLEEIAALEQEIKALEKKQQHELQLLWRKIYAIRNTCKHEHTQKYSDYYSKITTCTDCGEEW